MTKQEKSFELIPTINKSECGMQKYSEIEGVIAHKSIEELQSTRRHEDEGRILRKVHGKNQKYIVRWLRIRGVNAGDQIIIISVIE